MRIQGMARLLRILFILVFFPAALSAVAGWYGATGFLHPQKRGFTPDMVRDADVTFAQIGAKREDLGVRAPDGAVQRGWKVRAAKPNGTWVLVFHGVADNRYGMTEHARLLLGAGYGVVMMDQRAHGASDGALASYGWLERKDASAVVDALLQTERPAHVFALGNSMGAGIALQSAGEGARIEAVGAEAPLPICRRRPTITPACSVGRLWGNRCSRRARGLWFAAAKSGRDSPQVTFPPSKPLSGAHFPCC